MSLSPVIGPEVPDAANGVASPDSPEHCSENGPNGVALGSAPLRQPVKRGGRVPWQASGDDGSLGETGETDGCLDGETGGHILDTVTHSNSHTDTETHTISSHTPPAQPSELCTVPPLADAPPLLSHEPLDEALLFADAQSDSGGSVPEDRPPPEGAALGAERVYYAEDERSETDSCCSVEDGGRESEGEKEKQDEEEDEKTEQHAGGHTEAEEEEHTAESSAVACAPPLEEGEGLLVPPSPPTASALPLAPPPTASALPLVPPPPPPAADSGSCPPHVMAQVRVRNVPERERLARGMQDSKSLDEISGACGGGRGGGRGGLGQPEGGRRATISSALELEGTVSHDGDLTHFITRNLEQKIKMSSKPSLDCDCESERDSDCSGPIHRSRGSSRRPADIPPIDPSVLLDLEKHTQEVAHSVEMMMRSLNGTIQNMTALSVGYIQTYRDSVDSLGESVDMSIKGMYTLMARCEELDRSMQPIHTLAAQIRDIKRTLDALEAICK